MTNKRKKQLENLVGFCLVIVMFIIFPCIGGYIDTHYAMNCEVKETNNDIITIKDATNNFWEFYGEEYRKGDLVKVTFYNNTTLSFREDDEITKVKILKSDD